MYASLGVSCYHALLMPESHRAHSDQMPTIKLECSHSVYFISVMPLITVLCTLYLFTLFPFTYPVSLLIADICLYSVCAVYCFCRSVCLAIYLVGATAELTAFYFAFLFFFSLSPHLHSNKDV